MAKELKQLLPFRNRTKLRESDRKFLESLDFDLFTTRGRGRQSTKEVIYEDSGDGDGRSVSSFSTNATMDNNIGPGRMLDKLYQYLGRRLEWGILRISMSSLHPNIIMHGLLLPHEIVVESDSDSDSDDGEPLKPESREVEKPVQMTDVIAELHEHHGSAAIAGLQSLVRQTQSKSLYRSAAALAALVHLAISESSDNFINFLCAVSKLEPIFQLEAKAMALDDSHPDKWLFLSVVSMARIPNSMGKYIGNPGFKTVYCLRQDLIKLMQEDQVVRHGSLYSLTKSLSLLFECLITAYATEDAQELAIRCLSQTSYFLILFFLIHLDNLLHYSVGMQQIGNLIMNQCIMIFGSKVWSPIKWLSVEGHHIFSPFKVFEERNRNPEVTLLLKGVYAKLGCWPHDGSSLQSCYLPRNYQGKGWSPHTIINRICMEHSRQLLSSSIDELKQEFLQNKYIDLHFKMPLRDGLLDLLQDEWSLENLRQTHERARKVEIIDNDVTREFIAARDHPHWQAEKEDYEYWRLYKRYCNRRRVWGECVRSDMDWDWDSGSCLTNLFKVKDAVANTVLEATTACQLYGYGSHGETAQMALEDARATLPKQIQVRYEDRKGRIRYKTYWTSPSTESIASGLSAPLTYPTIDLNDKEEAEGGEEGDEADRPSIYESALEFPLD